MISSLSYPAFPPTYKPSHVFASLFFSSRIYCLINLSAYCGCIIDLAVFLSIPKGFLFVIYCIGCILSTCSNGSKTRLFLCECECGNRSKVLGHVLRKGLSKSCGKCNQPKINQRFGKLVVLKEDIEREEKEKKRQNFWICQCDCGNIISIAQKSFKVQQSCGCLKSKSNAQIERFLKNKNIT